MEDHLSRRHRRRRVAALSVDARQLPAHAASSTYTAATGDAAIASTQRRWGTGGYPLDLRFVNLRKA
jgi:hypothetical protein